MKYRYDIRSIVQKEKLYDIYDFLCERVLLHAVMVKSCGVVAMNRPN